MNKVQARYKVTKKDALCRLKNRVGRPDFPLSLWEPILLNQYVDFGKIFAIWSGDIADEQTIHATDHFKFIINQIESKGPVATEPAWTTAFGSYSKAVIFTYPH